MTGIFDLISDFWGVIMAAVGGVAWLVRLESRSITTSKDLKKYEQRNEAQRKEDLERASAQRASDLSEARRSRDDTKEMLAEMRSDIKTLLQRRD